MQLASLRTPSAARAATVALVSAPEVADGTLIERVAAREREAFEELYGRYARSVLGLALRRLGDRGRAEDSVQEVFAAVWRSASSYDRARGPGGAWLYTIARNAIVDAQRRRPAPTVADPPELVSTECDPGRGGRGVMERLESPSCARDAAGARTGRDRPRVLLGPLPERGRRVSRDSARHRQDTNAQRPRPPRRDALAGGRAVSERPPSFDDIVEADDPERSRLQTTHELLVAAGPPPELPPWLEAAPPEPRTSVIRLPRRRYTAIAAVAVAALVLFAAGMRSVAVAARSSPCRRLR